jgi:hypothetical protein
LILEKKILLGRSDLLNNIWDTTPFLAFEGRGKVNACSSFSFPHNSFQVRGFAPIGMME